VSLELRIAPPEVADAPTHHEIDVTPATSYVEVAVSLFAEMALAPLSRRHDDDSAENSRVLQLAGHS
jgi:hypothetical protein